MSKIRFALAIVAAVALTAAPKLHAAEILIGGTSLTLVYDSTTGLLCDGQGCGAYRDTAMYTDAALLTSLDFEVDSAPVGSLSSPTTQIYVDVYFANVALTPGAPSSDSTFSGFIDFYTVGPDGTDFLRLNVGAGAITYNGGSFLFVGSDMTVVSQDLTYSFGNFLFTDPGVTWAFSSANASNTTTTIQAVGTPDWADDSVEFDRPVPEPGSMILLGTGLMGLAASARRRLRRNKEQ